MTLKKINPEDLVEGSEYYVKMKLRETDDSDTPFCFRSRYGDDFWFYKDEYIYTLEDQPIYTHESSTDTELEMLVNVASRLLVAYGASQGTMPSDDKVAKEARNLITACKNALKEVKHD